MKKIEKKWIWVSKMSDIDIWIYSLIFGFLGGVVYSWIYGTNLKKSIIAGLLGGGMVALYYTIIIDKDLLQNLSKIL